MTVQVNGAPHELTDEATVATVLDLLDLGPAPRGVAVAVDAEVVPRRTWEQTRLHPGARVEILTATQGG